VSASFPELARELDARSAREGWCSSGAEAQVAALRAAGLVVDGRDAPPDAGDRRDFVLCATDDAAEARAWAAGASRWFVLVASNRRRLQVARADAGPMLAVAWSLGQVKQQLYPVEASFAPGFLRSRLAAQVIWLIDVGPRGAAAKRRRALGVVPGHVTDVTAAAPPRTH
jgi:hypothetical protein